MTRDPEDLHRADEYGVANAANSRLDENMDPDALRDPDEYNRYVDLALADDEYMGSPFQFGTRPYWLIDNGECTGTMGYLVRDADLEFTDVYIRPRFRRQGRARRAFQTIKEAARDAGIDRFLVYCHWGNQDALRFYLTQGMWVFHWKRALRLSAWHHQPTLQMRIEGTRASFLVEDRVLGVAENRGDRLEWNSVEGIDNATIRHALEPTAALYLAVQGWPIIRSDELWKQEVRSGYSESGSFEGLAFRIRQYECELRRYGWKVPPPNPSFATLPHLVHVERKQEHLEVTISDGRIYPFPYELLSPSKTDLDSVVNAQVQVDAVMCTLSNGETVSVSIDEILHVNQTPEELEETLAFWREQRDQARAQSADEDDSTKP